MSLSLRPVRIEDSTVVAKWKQDPFIKRMALDYDYQTTSEKQQADIEASLLDADSEYQIMVLNQVPIGYIRIDWLDTGHRVAWLRFAIGEERGNGYSILALRLYLSDLFDNGCVRVEGEVYAFNTASQHVLESLGFQQEGTKRNAHFDGTTCTDIYMYGLLKQEFIC